MLPRIRCPSFAIVPGSIVASTPAAGMPTITIVPAAAQEQRALLDGTRRADRDDDVVGAAPTGEREYRGDGVLGCRVDGVRRAEGTRRLELRVRRDRSRRPSPPRRWTAPCTAFSPTPPVPITTTLAPGLDRGGVDDGAEARDHAAGEQRGAVERELARDPDRLRRVDDDLLGERPGAEPLGDRAAVGVGQRPAPVERKRRIAERRLTVRARRACTAGADERHDDVVALREPSTPAPTSTTTPAASCPNTAGSEPPQAPSR